MKTFAKLILAAFFVTICVALGFGVADWLEIPSVLVPLFLLPATFVFARFDRKRLDWIKTTLFFLALGVSTWLIQLLTPAHYGDRFAFMGPVLLLVFLPSLGRIYDRIRKREGHH